MLNNDDLRLMEYVRQLRDDLPLFARTCLRVRTKGGELVPLVFNASQMKLHRQAEEQKARTGHVRMIVPKGRRQGISTYVAARFYHRTAMNKRINTMIMAHEQPSSDALYEIVERYQENNPLQPSIGAANIKELVFDKLDSKYIVATAGSKGVGRGMGLTLFHGSEVAFWPNAAEHFAASIQAVPLLPGTEIFLESTAFGPSGEFYERTMQAVAGVGDYEVCFLPWTIEADNERDEIPNLELSTDRGSDVMSEAEYADAFNLTPRQRAWMHYKRAELRSPRRFHQEYPADLSLAFIAADADGYHDPNLVLRARKNPDKKGEGPLIMGVDPAGEGGDRFAIAFRRGHAIEEVIWRDKIDSEEAAIWLKDLIDERNPEVVFIDAGGIGRPIISRLRAFGPRYSGRNVRAVNFGSPSQFKLAKPRMPGPKNRRAEMQERLKEWLSEDGVSIPDMDALQADLLITKVKPTATNDLLLESKHDIRARGERSPDLADACGLCFAESVYSPPPKKKKVTANHAQGVPEDIPFYDDDYKVAHGSSWMAG